MVDSLLLSDIFLQYFVSPIITASYHKYTDPHVLKIKHKVARY